MVTATQTTPSIRIAVTCVGGRLIYDTLTALRAAPDFNPWILGIDADPVAHGRLLCDEFATLPHAGRDPDGWINQILSLTGAKKLDVLIVLSDAESRVAAKHRDSLLEKGVKPSVSSARTVNAMTDKLLLLEKLASEGINVGEFVGINTVEEFRRGLEMLGYPRARVVLKPRAAAGSRGVIIVDSSVPQWRALLHDRFCGTASADVVKGKMAEMDVAFEHMVLVPHLEGPVFDVDCIAKDGVATDISARLRQLKNPLSPTSTGHRIVLDHRVIEYARELTRVLNIQGAADYDIVLAEGREARIFDAGARFSGSIGGSISAGANFPAQLVRVLMGWHHEPLIIRDGTPIRPFITMGRIPDDNSEMLL